MKRFLLFAFLWLFTNTASAQIWQYIPIPFPNTQPYFDIGNIDEAPNGDIVCNTSEGLLFRQSGSWSILSNPYGVSLGNITVTNNYFDNQGRLWVSQYGSDIIYYYDSGIWEAVWANPVDPDVYLSTIARDESGRVWAFEDSWSFGTGYGRCLTDTTVPVLIFGSGVGERCIFTDDHLYMDAGVFDLGGNYLGAVAIDFGYTPTHATDDGRLVVYNYDVSSDPAMFFIIDGLDVDTIEIPGYNSACCLIMYQVIGNHFYYRRYLSPTQQAVMDYDLVSNTYQLINIDYVDLVVPGSGANYHLRQAGEKLYLFNYYPDQGEDLFLLEAHPLSTNKIEGHVFLDDNANGLYDLSEGALANQVLSLLPNGYYSATNDSGIFRFYLADTTGTYNVDFVNQYLNWELTTPNNYAVIQTQAAEISNNINFGLSPISVVSDVAANVLSTPARPGMMTGHFVQVFNVGTEPYAGTVEISLDDQFTFVSSNWLPTGIVGNLHSFSVPTLQPFGIAQLQIIAMLSTTATPGDTVFTTANVINPADANPSDNQTIYAKVITASFDPNMKEVSPAGLGSNNVIPAGANLTYTVHFQNTGTDTAFNIVVRDTIASQYLDMGSFKLNAYSHLCQLDINGAGNVAFKFNNILLPDSNTNEPLSHGFVQYEINVKDNAPNGSLVQNTAHIYFDYNAPVVTNTTSNLIGEPNAVREINVSTISVIPNPASDFISIARALNARNVSIYNVLGQPVQQNDMVESKIDVKELAPGFYFIEATTTNGLVRSGFVKQ